MDLSYSSEVIQHLLGAASKFPTSICCSVGPGPAHREAMPRAIEVDTAVLHDLADPFDAAAGTQRVGGDDSSDAAAVKAEEVASTYHASPAE